MTKDDATVCWRPAKFALGWVSSASVCHQSRSVGVPVIVTDDIMGVCIAIIEGQYGSEEVAVK